MSQEYLYFYEDEIYRINKRGRLELGMVLENAELFSSDEEVDSVDDDKVTKGNIRVAWHPSGEEQVLPERKVGLGDRSLMPGDVVRRMVKGKDTQRGYCRSVNVSACVNIVGTKFVIVNVDSRHLTPLEEFTSDVAVALDSWVGMVTQVKSKLTLVMTDGSKCVMLDDRASLLEEVDDFRDRETEFRRYDFYRGQQLTGHWKHFDGVQWLTEEKEEKDPNWLKLQKMVQVMVENVEVVQLNVRWQCRVDFSSDDSGRDNADKEQPKCVILGEDLKRVKMLNVFEPCTLQLGDRNYYVLREEDLLLTKDRWNKLTTESLLSEDSANPFLRRHVTKGAVGSTQSERGEASPYGRTNADVVREEPDFDAIPANHDPSSEFSLYSVRSGPVHKCCKKGPSLMTKVLKKRKLKRTKEKAKPVVTPSFGGGRTLVVETLMTKSRASVVWQDGSVEEDIPSTVLFPIHHLDDQEFFPGDLVVEQRGDTTNDHHHHHKEYGVIQKVDHAGRVALVKWFKTYAMDGGRLKPFFSRDREMSVYDLKDHPEYRYRPGSVVIRVGNFEEGRLCSTGQVLDSFPTGEISVWWVDGKRSLCYPQDLHKVGEYDSDEGELWGDVTSSSSSSSSDDDDESWETESEHSSSIATEEGEENNENSDQLLKTKVVASIEKVRIAMSRLEEIFAQNPMLQTTNVTKQLLDCYRECRSMDKVMGTNLFHESNFVGLMEKVRGGKRSTHDEDDDSCDSSSTKQLRSADDILSVVIPPNRVEEESPRDHNDDGRLSTSSSGKSFPRRLAENVDEPTGVDSAVAVLTSSEESVLCENLANISLLPNGSLNYSSQDVRGAMRTDHTGLVGQQANEHNDFRASSDTQLGVDGVSAASVTKLDSCGSGSSSGSSSNCGNVCAQLCLQMKVQLLKAYEQVVSQFGGHFDMSFMRDFQESEKKKKKKKKNCDWKKHQVEPKETVEENGDGDGDGDSDSTILVVRSSIFENDAVVTPLEIGHSLNSDGFRVLSAAPNSHKFKLTMFQPSNPVKFYRAVRNELNLLSSSTPDGIWVRGYEDRMDLYSVMIRGPERTPYEGGLMFFDFQLSADYPRAPPLCHYISYCSEKLNPNLYEDGKVCVSLLGTWNGKGTEVWSTTVSNLLQVIISIQGLILVSEPYFNEAGYQKQKGTQQGRENSRMYNEMVVLKLIQAMTKVVENPPVVFADEIARHFEARAHGLVSKLEKWLEISESLNEGEQQQQQQHPPSTAYIKDLQTDYPLLPASKGFCITLRKTLETFKVAAL